MTTNENENVGTWPPKVEDRPAVKPVGMPDLAEIMKSLVMDSSPTGKLPDPWNNGSQHNSDYENSKSAMGSLDREKYDEQIPRGPDEFVFKNLKLSGWSTRVSRRRDASEPRRDFVHKSGILTVGGPADGMRTKNTDDKFSFWEKGQVHLYRKIRFTISQNDFLDVYLHSSLPDAAAILYMISNYSISRNQSEANDSFYEEEEKKKQEMRDMCQEIIHWGDDDDENEADSGL